MQWGRLPSLLIPSRISFGLRCRLAQSGDDNALLLSLFAFSARWRDEIYNRLLLGKMPLVILFIISQRWVG